MKYIIFILVTFYSSSITKAIILPGAKSSHKPTQKQKTNCCPLFNTASENVRLIKLCQLKHSTVFYMQLDKDANACSYLDKISLVDNNGKSYKPIALHTIPNCPNTKLMKNHISFSWEFEKIEKNAISINLEEDSTAASPTSGAWNWWKWIEVSIKHCKF